MTVYLGPQVRAAILSLRNGIGIERACLYYVGTCGKIFCVYLAYDIGAGKHQQVIVALERTGMSRKQRAAEIPLAKGVLLDHGPHGSVENQNTFLYCIFKIHFQNNLSIHILRVAHKRQLQCCHVERNEPTVDARRG